MKLSEFKKALAHIEQPVFRLPNGEKIPAHFHVTEVGQVSKNFIDCGGTVRNETAINFQLWYATDTDHRLSIQRLKQIIDIAEQNLDLIDAPIEVEYQMETIGKFGLEIENGILQLTNKQTDCLALDKCNIPEEKNTFIQLDSFPNASNDGGGCCPPGCC